MSGRGSSGLGIGAAIITMVLLASCSAGGREPGTTSPVTVSPSASPSMHIFAKGDCPDLTCHGTLQPGTYRSTILEPTIDFEIASPGWIWDFSAGGFRLIADTSHADLYSPDGIYFLRDPAIASQDCAEREEPGVGRSVQDLVAWLETAPGLAVSEPTPVTIGGLDGMQLDLRLDPHWTQTCEWSGDMPVVPLVFNGAAQGGYNWAMLPEMSSRWYILDSRDGVVIVDIEDGPGGASHDELMKTGGEIVDSLAFS